MKKTKIYLFGIIITILIVAVIVSMFQSQARHPREIRIGYNFESVNLALIIIAHEKSYFEKHGLYPVMLPLKGTDETRQAMVANQVDIGMGGFTNFLPPIVEGAPIKIIAPGVLSGAHLFVRPNSPIKKIADLEGKTVNDNPGGVTYSIFNMIASKEGVDLKNVKHVDVDKAYQALALTGEKQIADAVLVSSQDTKMMYDAGAVLLDEWKEKKYNEFLAPNSMIAARTDFIERDEALVSDFLKALADAHRLIKENPAEAALILTTHIDRMTDGAIKRNPKDIEKQWAEKQLVNIAWVDPAIVMNMTDQLFEAGLLDRKLLLEEVFDLRFEKQLQADQLSIYGNE